MEAEKIDVTPSWQTTAIILCEILENGSDKEFAKAELVKMGTIIDQLHKDINQLKFIIDRKEGIA